MEKIVSGRSEDIPPIKIFIDDLEQIVGIVREVSKDVKIVIDSYKLNDLSEISEIKCDTIKYVHILIIADYLWGWQGF